MLTFDILYTDFSRKTKVFYTYNRVAQKKTVATISGGKNVYANEDATVNEAERALQLHLAAMMMMASAIE